jgi:aryl-alcohol dehydrogenase-like predicted oxidoreductase
MAWSPLASGLLAGKYEPGPDGGAHGEGRLQTVAGSGNPVFDKFTERNWRIVDTLREVAAELGAPMAQVAVAWVLNRPGVASVLVAATKAAQLRETLTALDLELPAAARQRLDAVSAPDPRFPYLFFQPAMQAMLTGGATVGDKPPAYAPDRTVRGDGAGVTGDAAD